MGKRCRVVGSELLNFFSTFLFILVSVIPIIKVVVKHRTDRLTSSRSALDGFLV